MASVLASSAIAALPPARRSAMMPEPITTASSSAVPSASDSSLRRELAGHQLRAIAISERCSSASLDRGQRQSQQAAACGSRWPAASTRRRCACLRRPPARSTDRRSPSARVTGPPGPVRAVLAAALSHTVITMRIAGAPAPANSSQLLLRKPLDVDIRLRSASSANGFTRPLGALPALYARTSLPSVLAQ